MTYTINIAPAHAGMVTATSSDGRSFTTTSPLLDGARYWQQLGAPSSAGIVTVWSSAQTTGPCAAPSAMPPSSPWRVTASSAIRMPTKPGLAPPSEFGSPPLPL